MCGLVGIIVLDRSQWHSIDREYTEVFKGMLVNARASGAHAAGVFTGTRGIADSDDGEILVQKAPGDPKVFVETEAYKKVHSSFNQSRTLYMIGHSRAATSGTASDNKNNHPFISGNIVGAHNGVIVNDNELARLESLKLKGQCDSEVIFALVDKNRTATMTLTDSVKDTCGDLRGWYACIMTDANEYGKLVLFRNRAPLDILYDRVDRVLLVASHQRWISEAIEGMPSCLLKNRKLEQISMDENSGAVIDCNADKSWSTVHRFKLEDDDDDLEVPPNSQLSDDEVMENWIDSYGPKKNDLKCLPPSSAKTVAL